ARLGGQSDQRFDAAAVRFAGGDPVVVRRATGRPDRRIARPATELLTRKPVADSGVRNSALQTLAIELRIVAAVRTAAAVDQHLDAVPLQQLEECLRR